MPSLPPIRDPAFEAYKSKVKVEDAAKAERFRVDRAALSVKLAAQNAREAADLARCEQEPQRPLTVDSAVPMLGEQALPALLVKPLSEEDLNPFNIPEEL